MAKVYLRSYNREIESMVDGGLLNEAVAHSLHILKIYPKHLETYRLLGKAYLELKQYSDASDIFSRLLACVPSDFVAHVGMAIIRDEQNQLDDAIWHMERAFETQPSNPAIQSELQRLYARRDGSAPPRIRMTRGALAQMYLQGELYPQAISEIKGVLKEDPGRTEMQALLARAHYRSGQKNEAAEVASSLLRRYPYCLDANRVLAEILGADRPESAESYRQRVFELDPYAAHVTSIFQSSDAPESAVAIEKLDWNGQPVGMPSDWRETRGIGLPSGDETGGQPAWLQSGYNDSDTLPPTPSAKKSNDDIPDFMRNAGWGESTGTFDESKSAFAEDKGVQTPAIAAGDLPDWVKNMAPAQAMPGAEEKEDVPDWMNRIDPGILGGTAAAESATDQPDWLKGIGEPASNAEPIQSASDQPDWLKGIGEPASSAEPIQPAADEPDWLKGLGDPASSAEPIPPASDEPDWLKGIAEPASSVESIQPATNEPDWLRGIEEPVSSAEAIQPAADLPDWLNARVSSAQSESVADDQTPDWLNSMEGETEKQEPTAFAVEPEPEAKPVPTPAMTEAPATTEKDLDDSFAWLEGLAAKQGATEGLLIKPEERLDQEPDWVKQAKSLSGEADQPAMASVPPEEVRPFIEPQEQPTAELESLGKTEQEQDDSFAWLENLAAKQGATEGLLTKPEERLQQEPDWVKQAKEIGEEETLAVTEMPASSDDTAGWLRSLDQAEEEEPVTASTDDTSVWLKGLDEQQGKSEPVAEDTTMWLRGLDDEDAKPEPATDAADETSMWLKGLDEEAKPEPTAEDTSTWLRGLDQEDAKQELVSSGAADETSMWLKSLDESETVPVAESTASDLPDWMQNLEEEKAEPEVEAVLPAIEEEVDAEKESDWSSSTDQPLPRTDTGELPSWLRGVDQSDAQTAAADDLPAWLRDETGEVVAEPVKIEPTHSHDWQPMEEATPPAPVMEDVEEVIEEKLKPAPKSRPERGEGKKQTPVTRKPESKPEGRSESYREPVTRKGVGNLTTNTDPVLYMARNELSRSNIPGALDTYSKLIKKGRYLDEVIFDLREALYRYPVEVSIWQSLGDAYMRANRLQDALDAYTKAEELLR